MSRLLARASRRFLLRHPGQLILALAGIALGVAVVVGVDLANDSASRAFELSSELVTGRATHQLVGARGTLADATFSQLRRELGVHRAAPVIEAPARLPALPGRAFTLLGVDPLAESPVRDVLTPVAARVDLARLIAVPGTVALPQALADELQAGIGSRIALVSGGREQPVEVVGIVAVDEAQAAIAGNYLFADIATAQELSGRPGRIARIDLVLDDAEARALASRLPAGTVLQAAQSRSDAIVEMTRAFQVNLRALALLALVVGGFLIYSTLSFLAVRRRQTAGMARALGLSRRQLFAAMFAQALVLGAAGTGLGLVLGHVLGAGLTGLVLRTIEDLYYAGAAAVRPGAWVYAKGAALGLGAALLAALAPAWSAARTAPRALLSRAELERGTWRRLPALALAGIASALAAWLVLRLETASLPVAFAGLFAVVAAAALLMPVAAALLLRGLQVPAQRLGGIPGRLAARGAAASLSRTGVAVTALAIAIAAVIGIGVMIQSFRGSVSEWLDATLQADYHLRLDPGLSAEGSDAFRPETIVGLRALRGVAGLSLSRWLRVPTGEGWTQLRAMQPGPRGWGLQIVEGDPPAAFAALDAGDAVMVSEPYARRHRVGAGDELTLPAAAGPARFRIAGVFRDYASDGGAVAIHLGAYRRHWQDPALTGVGVYRAPGADAAALRARLERLVAANGALQMSESAELRAASMRIFERTFTITEVLRWLAGLVAFFGILSSLLALELERSREIGVLRAIGFVPAQVKRLVLAQTGLLGLVAGLLAIPLGIVLAALLVFVINERAFGWSMAFEVPVEVPVSGLAMALIAALAAGLAPAWRLARMPLAAALREE